MFYNASAARQYASVAIDSKVNSANPHRLIALLYEGAIEAVNQAKAHGQAGQFGKKAQVLNKAINIITDGLKASLNVEAGGEIARNLADLYDYMVATLFAAGRSQELQKLETVARLLEELKQAWADIDPERQNLMPPAELTAQTGNQPAQLARTFAYG